MENCGKRQDERAVGLFLAVLIALSLLFYTPLAMTGSLGAWGGWAVFLLMWAPGTAAVVTTLTLYHSLQPLALLGNRRVFAWSALCLALPVLYTVLIYEGLSALAIIDVRMNDAGLAIWAFALAQSVMSAFGEELGWRGFASPLFSRLWGFKMGQLVLGIIWYLYHLPPLLFTDYGSSPHPLFGNVMFLVSVVSLSILLGVARQASNSVWPSTLYRKRRLRLAVTHKCLAALRYGPLRRGRRDGRSHAILLPSLAARRKRGRDNPRGVRPP